MGEVPRASPIFLIMVNFAISLLDFMMFPFRSASPLVIIPAAYLCVIGAFRFIKRFMFKS